jgi:enoyl-CoA hydratase/carnithine racemase
LQEKKHMIQQSTVRIEKSGRIAILYLDKPPVNAIDLRLLRDAEECLENLKDMENTCAVVITGAGKCFSAGLDLKVVPRYGPEEQREMIQRVNRMVTQIYAFPKPTVGATNGHAIAGGFILAISCDYRVGTTSPCELGVTESRVGIPFPAATMEVLKGELAPAVARRMVLSGCNIGPEDALASGILDELQPADRLLSRAKEVALGLGALPAAGYGQIKRQLRAETIARIENTIKMSSDPLLDSWIAGEARTASAEMLKQDAKNDK